MGVVDENALALFLSIGMEEGVAKNALANAKVAANLTACIDEVWLAPSWPKLHALLVAEGNQLQTL